MHIGSQTADRVVVLMCIYQEAYRFVRNALDDLFNYGEIALLIEWSFDDCNIFLELYYNAVV